MPVIVRVILAAGVALAATAAAADPFRPSMVEVGSVEDGQHVAFTHPFPMPPAVALAIGEVFGTAAVPIKCEPHAFNVTTAGFDYTAKCNFALHPKATWIATAFND